MGILTIKVKTIDASDGAESESESESREDAGGNNYKEALKLITFILYYAYYNTFEEPLNEHLYQQILDVQSEKTSMSFALTLGEMLKVMNKQSESIEEDSTLTQTPEAIAKRKNNSDVIAELSHMMAQELEGELLEGLNAGVIRKATTRLKAQVHEVIDNNILDGVGNIISVNGKTIGTKSSILTPKYYEEQSELHRLLNREKYMYIILALKTISTNVEGHNNNLLYKLTLQNAYNVTKNSIPVKTSDEITQEITENIEKEKAENIRKGIKVERIIADTGFSDPYTLTIKKTIKNTPKKEDENISSLSLIQSNISSLSLIPSNNPNENDFGFQLDAAGFIVNLIPNGLFAKAGLKIGDILFTFKRCYTQADVEYLKTNDKLKNKADWDKGKAQNVLASIDYEEEFRTGGEKLYKSMERSNQWQYNHLLVLKHQMEQVKAGDEVEVSVILKGNNVSLDTMSTIQTTLLKVATQKLKVDEKRKTLSEKQISPLFDITFNKLSSLDYDINYNKHNTITQYEKNTQSIFFRIGLDEGDILKQIKIGNEVFQDITDSNLQSEIARARDNDIITLKVQVKPKESVVNERNEYQKRLQGAPTMAEHFTPKTAAIATKVARAVGAIPSSLASLGLGLPTTTPVAKSSPPKTASSGSVSSGLASLGSALSGSALSGSASSTGPLGSGLPTVAPSAGSSLPKAKQSSSSKLTQSSDKKRRAGIEAMTATLIAERRADGAKLMAIKDNKMIGPLREAAVARNESELMDVAVTPNTPIRGLGMPTRERPTQVPVLKRVPESSIESSDNNQVSSETHASSKALQAQMVSHRMSGRIKRDRIKREVEAEALDKKVKERQAQVDQLNEAIKIRDKGILSWRGQDTVRKILDKRTEDAMNISTKAETAKATADAALAKAKMMVEGNEKTQAMARASNLQEDAVKAAKEALEAASYLSEDADTAKLEEPKQVEQITERAMNIALTAREGAMTARNTQSILSQQSAGKKTQKKRRIRRKIKN